jgi:fumarylpyruvate hydrolase
MPTHTVPIAHRQELFSVNRVFCVAGNYAARVREMGREPEREAPSFFMKPACAVVGASTEEVAIAYPPMTSNFHRDRTGDRNRNRWPIRPSTSWP